MTSYNRVLCVALGFVAITETVASVPSACELEDNSMLQLGTRRATSSEADARTTPEICSAKCGWPASTFNYGATKRWGTDFAPYSPLCALGARQAPIDINTFATVGIDRTFELGYHSHDNLAVVNTGHNLEVEGHFGTLTDKSDYHQHIVYDAKQYHIHAPSEHHINGMAAAMELHIVHKRISPTVVPDVAETAPLISRPRALVEGHGELQHEDNTSRSISGPADFEPYYNNTVVAILFKEGPTTNPCIKAMLGDTIPQVSCSECIGSIDLVSCFEEQFDGGFYVYDGSLTTPPCTERVQFYVAEMQAEISSQDLARFKRASAVDARPVQPSNGRLVAHMRPRRIHRDASTSSR